MLTYDVYGTNVAVEFILYLKNPIDRQALGRAIQTGKQRLWNRLKEEGDDWLAGEDDPFISTTAKECWIRVDSVKGPGGRSRLTYRTLLAVFEAFWNVLYLLRNEKEGSMRIKVAEILAGYAAARVSGPESSAISLFRKGL